MTAFNDEALKCLAKLVEYVFEHRSGLTNGITYKDLAEAIGRLDRHRRPHAHGMGDVLVKLGNLLREHEGRWGEAIPQIQSLVVRKNPPNKGLPDDGIKVFWPDYPKMNQTEKGNRAQVEYKRVTDFGSRWNDVLDMLSCPRIAPPSGDPGSTTSYGAGGESLEHKRLKEFVLEHPALVGASSCCESFVEYPLPSGDEIDILFKAPGECIAVEVKSSISDGFEHDYERGLYQTIKYAALLGAMSAVRDDIPPSIKSILVLQSALPKKLRSLAEKLQVEVIEEIRMPGVK